MGVWVTEIRRPAPRSLRAFAARLRDSDAGEVLGTSGVPRAGVAAHLTDLMRDDLAAGGRAWAVLDGPVTLALFGARPDSLTSDSASVWMLASRAAEGRPVAFGRWSKAGLGILRAAFPQVSAFYNFAPESGRTAEWLRWLGAWFSASVRFRSPWTGGVYARFVIET